METTSNQDEFILPKAVKKNYAKKLQMFCVYYVNTVLSKGDQHIPVLTHAGTSLSKPALSSLKEREALEMGLAEEKPAVPLPRVLVRTK